MVLFQTEFVFDVEVCARVGIDVLRRFADGVISLAVGSSAKSSWLFITESMPEEEAEE